MKKIVLSLGIIAVLILSSMVSTVYADDNQSKQQRSTHTVFVEAGTASWCGPCATAASEMASIYSSGSYDYEYVALVSDKNTYADSRCTQLGISSIPHYFFDGNFDSHLGSGSLPGAYTSRIESAGDRTVADIGISLSASCFESTQYLVDIDVDLINNEASTYSGYVRCFVTEKVSRWNTAGGQPYHHAMIGNYAFNQAVSIPAGGTLSLSTTWDGSGSYSDLEQSNTMILVAVYDAGGGSGLVDESKAKTPTLITNDPPLTPSAPSGPSDGIPETSYSFSSSTTDPDGNDVYYLFDWGDGSNSSWLGPYASGASVSAAHSWFTAGMHDVRVKAKDIWDEESEWSSISSFEIIDAPPGDPAAPSGPVSGYHSVSYSYSTSAVTDPDGDDVEYQFDWGDGNVSAWSSSLSASYIWAVPGTYDVSVMARDIYGAQSASSPALSVVMGNRAPITPGKPTGPQGGAVGIEYSFIGATSDPEDDPMQYQFDWGDGTLSGWSEEYQQDYIWEQSGIFSVRMRARDSWNVSDWSPSRSVEITEPVLVDAGGPYEVVEGQVLEFSGSVSGGSSPFRWVWDFGDGESSDDEEASHIYLDEGVYTVVLTVDDRYDTVGSDTAEVVVLAAGSMLADAGGPYEGIPDVEIDFVGSVEGGEAPFTWSWDFGDGATSSEQNPSHSFAAAGSYEVTLYVEDSFGMSDLDTATVTVYENSAPGAPEITGPAEGKFDVEYSYNFSAVDPEGNDVFFVIDWGDGSEVESAVVGSGQVLQVAHTWSEKDEFTIQAKAVDIWDAESEWASLVVSMPYTPSHPVLELLLDIFSCLFERFPLLGCLWDLVL